MKTNLFRWSCCILLLAFTSCPSCKKTEPTPESTLPPATQTGANTFGCLIDGQPWIPNGGGGFSLLNAINGGYLNRANPPESDGKDKNRFYLFTNKTDKTSVISDK